MPDKNFFLQVIACYVKGVLTKNLIRNIILGRNIFEIPQQAFFGVRGLFDNLFGKLLPVGKSGYTLSSLKKIFKGRVEFGVGEIIREDFCRPVQKVHRSNAAS